MLVPKLRHFSNTHIFIWIFLNFLFHRCIREWSYTLITSVWGLQRAHSVLLVMFKHKETPTTPPFLVCADSQRSGISQLWKLVSMETRVGRRVMMLLAEQQSRISHVLQCVLMWVYRRQTQRGRDVILPLKEGWFRYLAVHAKYLLSS